jgi:hypothetical protein
MGQRAPSGGFNLDAHGPRASVDQSGQIAHALYSGESADDAAGGDLRRIENRWQTPLPTLPRRLPGFGDDLEPDATHSTSADGSGSEDDVEEEADDDSPEDGLLQRSWTDDKDFWADIVSDMLQSGLSAKDYIATNLLIPRNHIHKRQRPAKEVEAARERLVSTLPRGKSGTNELMKVLDLNPPDRKKVGLFISQLRRNERQKRRQRRVRAASTPGAAAGAAAGGGAREQEVTVAAVMESVPVPASAPALSASLGERLQQIHTAIWGGQDGRLRQSIASELMHPMISPADEHRGQIEPLAQSMPGPQPGAAAGVSQGEEQRYHRPRGDYMSFIRFVDSNSAQSWQRPNQRGGPA